MAVGAWVPPPPTHWCLDVSHPGGFKGTLPFSAVMHRIGIVCFFFADVIFEVDFYPFHKSYLSPHSWGVRHTEYEEGWDLCLHSSGERKASKTPKAPAWGCEHQEWKSLTSENAWSALLKDVTVDLPAPSRQRASRKEEWETGVAVNHRRLSSWENKAGGLQIIQGQSG